MQEFIYLKYIFGHVVAGSVPPVPGFSGVIRGMSYVGNGR